MTTKPENYRNGWARLSKLVRLSSPVCAWCDSRDDLCADHLVPGRPELGVRTLCRSCNADRRNGATGPRRGPRVR